jgi:hypothetical protein
MITFLDKDYLIIGAQDFLFLLEKSTEKHSQNLKQGRR